MTNKYIDDFFKLNCASDILDAVSPISGGNKEITESIAVIKRIKSTILRYPNEVALIDLCAGNCLTGIIAAHLLPVYESLSIDRVYHFRKGHSLVNKWKFIEGDIYDFDNLDYFTKAKKIIVIGVHPCGELSDRILELSNRSKKSLGAVVMPCCLGRTDSFYKNVPFLDKYQAWCMTLADSCKSPRRLTVDKHVMSPKNIVISDLP